MTTIAWDGRELAGDRLWTMGGLRVAGQPKVHRLIAPNGRVALFGFSGDSAHLVAYLAWLAGGERPFGVGPGTWSMIMIDDRRVVHYRHNDAQVWDRLGCCRFTIGSGARYARGAMEAGKGAAAAVRIAANLDVDTGRGVRVVRF